MTRQEILTEVVFLIRASALCVGIGLAAYLGAKAAIDRRGPAVCMCVGPAEIEVIE